MYVRLYLSWNYNWLLYVYPIQTMIMNHTLDFPLDGAAVNYHIYLLTHRRKIWSFLHPTTSCTIPWSLCIWKDASKYALTELAHCCNAQESVATDCKFWRRIHSFPQMQCSGWSRAAVLEPALSNVTWISWAWARSASRLQHWPDQLLQPFSYVNMQQQALQGSSLHCV